MAGEPSRSERTRPRRGANLALQAVRVNSFWMVVPVLAINLAFGGSLPPRYQPDVFWRDIPALLAAVENTGRMLVTILPLAMAMGWSATRERLGWLVYTVGLLLYGACWAALVLAPNSGWSGSFIGFAGPAITPSLWLAGIGFVGGSRPYWGWVPGLYWLSAGVFLASHVAHAALVFSRGP